MHGSVFLSDKPDFMRDIIALMLVIGIIIGVAFDQTVSQCQLQDQNYTNCITYNIALL